MAKVCSPEYLAKVKLLTKEETERLLSRMGNKLDRRLERHKVSQEEALASQLELEDEQLQEWRKTMLDLKKKEAAKNQEKPQAKPQAKPKEAAKKESKSKTVVKAKVAPKPKVPAKSATKAGK